MSVLYNFNSTNKYRISDQNFSKYTKVLYKLSKKAKKIYQANGFLRDWTAQESTWDMENLQNIQLHIWTHKKLPDFQLDWPINEDAKAENQDAQINIVWNVQC